MTPVGYSGTPLTKKLGLKAGYRVYFHSAPPELGDWLGPLPVKVEVLDQPVKPLDLAMIFARTVAELTASWSKVQRALATNGMIWACWPKKAAKVPTDLDETAVREFGLSTGMVDVKVCAVSPVWSGHKFVVRLADRPTA